MTWFRVNRVRGSIVANFLGQGWSAVLGFVLLPFYLHLMGAEAFGLIGFYQTLLVTLNVFDFGFSTTINRELACHSAREGRAENRRIDRRTQPASVQIRGQGGGRLCRSRWKLPENEGCGFRSRASCRPTTRMREAAREMRL